MVLILPNKMLINFLIILSLLLLPEDTHRAASFFHANREVHQRSLRDR